MKYDFKAARQHRSLLVDIYRTMKRHFEDNGTWSWWLQQQIDEIDQEIAAVHNSLNAKMTPVTSSGHQKINYKNIIIPIVPHWRGNVQSQ